MIAVAAGLGTLPFADLDRELGLADIDSWGQLGGFVLGMRDMWGRLVEAVGAERTLWARELAQGPPQVGIELIDSRACWLVAEAAGVVAVASLDHPLEAAREAAEVQNHRKAAAFSKADRG